MPLRRFDPLLRRFLLCPDLETRSVLFPVEPELSQPPASDGIGPLCSVYETREWGAIIIGSPVLGLGAIYRGYPLWRGDTRVMRQRGLLGEWTRAVWRLK